MAVSFRELEDGSAEVLVDGVVVRVMRPDQAAPVLGAQRAAADKEPEPDGETEIDDPGWDTSDVEPEPLPPVPKLKNGLRFLKPENTEAPPWKDLSAFPGGDDYLYEDDFDDEDEDE